MDNEMDEYNYVSSKEARTLLGVSIDTLRSWDKQDKIATIRTPTGFRRYSKKDIYRILGRTIPTKEKQKIAYCRVSSKHQEDDLNRQQEYFRSNHPDYKIISDIGSGINWKRKGLNAILDAAIEGDIDTVMVAHRDRLCRFAFELIQNIITKAGGKLIVLDSDEHQSENQELAEDILSIIHVYSCRANGKRRYKSKKNKDISKSDSEENNEELDRGK